MRKQTIREWAIANFGSSPRVLAQYVEAIAAHDNTLRAGVLHHNRFYGFGFNSYGSVDEMKRVMKFVVKKGGAGLGSYPITKVTKIRCELLEGEAS